MAERNGGFMDDLISRQEAIDALDKIFPADPMRNNYTQGITCGAALATEYIKQLPSAHPETHDKRTKTHSCDCISRQDAIDAHYEYCNKHPDAGFPVWSLKILEDLPSAQPYTEAEIQKMQDLEQAQMDKAYELGYEEGKVSAQPEIIMCKECKHYQGEDSWLHCNRVTWSNGKDDFCSGAERRTDEGD